jgi:hypothetical protein
MVKFKINRALKKIRRSPAFHQLARTSKVRFAPWLNGDKVSFIIGYPLCGIEGGSDYLGSSRRLDGTPTSISHGMRESSELASLCS